MQMSEHGYVPTKICLQKQDLSQGQSWTDLLLHE